MLHAMIDRGEDIHSVIWFDTGWEFEGMHMHIHEIRDRLKIDIVILYSDLPFEEWMFHREVIARKGPDNCPG